jgi:hypothetical protein
VPRIEQASELESLKTRVCNDQHASQNFQKPYIDRFERWYTLYRASDEFTRRSKDSAPRGRDVLKRAFKREFGDPLVIPYIYSLIETIQPRLLSNNPTVNVLPRGDVAPENVEAMKFVMDAQTEKMRFGLKLHPVCKDGLMYGLGVGKTFWRTEYRNRKRLAEATEGAGFVSVEKPEAQWDDPDFGAIDPWDFFWDPYGEDVETCEYVIQRSWRSSRYVRRMIESGAWDAITEDDDLDLILSGSPKNRYSDVWSSRREAGGVGAAKTDKSVHEVWEWHDGERVITVLDGDVVVKVAENYWHGEKPFHIYRPNPLSHEFVGVSEIEMAEVLSEEMNQIRGLRLDFNWLTLLPTFAYAEGVVDPDEFKFGRGKLIGVPGDPNELIKKLEVGQPPGTSYQETSEIRDDLDRTSGLSDTVAGQEAKGDTTATEVQLLQAAANVRIQLKTELLEEQIITPHGNQQIALNQQKITSDRGYREPEPPQPGVTGTARYKWRTVTPKELMGTMEAVAVGGATAPDNVPQMRSDAQVWAMLVQNPHIDPRMASRKVLENLGIKDPDTYLAPMPPPLVPQEFLAYLVGLGVPTQAIQEAIQATGAVVEQVQREEAEEEREQDPASQNGQSAEPRKVPA